MIPRCTVTATLHDRPENGAELVALLASFVAPSRSEPGCNFYENWSTRADLDRHLELPYQKNRFGRHKAFLTEDAS